MIACIFTNPRDSFEEFVAYGDTPDEAYQHMLDLYGESYIIGINGCEFYQRMEVKYRIVFE